MNAKALYSILFLLVNIASWAQVQFVTQISRDKIGINEVLEVRFVMNVDGDHINPPNFSNFQVVGGPMQSYNSSWVNGKTSRTVSVGYFLQPTKKGKITIGSATMEYEGKTYKTRSDGTTSRSSTRWCGRRPGGRTSSPTCRRCGAGCWSTSRRTSRGGS